MIKLRQAVPFIFHPLQSCYVHFSSRNKAQKRTKDNMKLLHEEKMRYVSSAASIKIVSDVVVNIKPADIHQYPNCDAFIAQLYGGPAKNCPTTLDVKVSDDEKFVEVTLKNLTKQDTDFCCNLQVPVKASLDVNSLSAVTVSKMFGDVLKVKANCINVSDIKADIIELESSNGNIVSDSLLMGRQTKIQSQGNGSILLDKLHGDQLNCKVNAGNISVKCCYVESSKFETNSGTLDLQNVHKYTEIHVHRDGNLRMIGVHGNIKVNFNGGIMDLQLSELVGQNYINVEKAKSSVINISDEIEGNTMIEAALDNSDASITLDTTMQHLTVGLHENKRQFKWPLEESQPNNLKIAIKDSLKLGKSSWMNMIKLRMGENTNVNESGNT